MCTPLCTQGALAPVAYAPAVEGTPHPASILDMLVTQVISEGTVVAFRFYPHLEGYQSTHSVTVSFVLTASLQPSTFLSLWTDADSNTMRLFAREKGVATWTAVSARSARVTPPAYATVYIFFATCARKCQPGSQSAVAAFGIRAPGIPGPTDPLFPPPCVLECKYTALAAASAATDFVYYPGASIPENWHQAWQVLRAATNWLSKTDPNLYPGLVETAEDTFNIKLIPGQLLPVGFTPYDNAYPAITAKWALVVTSAIPANTKVYLWAGNWSDQLDNPPSVGNVSFAWTSPNYEICPGQIVQFGRLGGVQAPYVCPGEVVVGSYAPADPIAALTAFSLSLQPSGSVNLAPITATYTCAYYDIIPECLVPGVSMRTCLWPVTASIIGLPTCRLACTWTEEAVLINNAPLVRWIDQPVPTYTLIVCRGCKTESAGKCCRDGAGTKSGRTIG
jgi:hypothetical protein